MKNYNEKNNLDYTTLRKKAEEDLYTALNDLIKAYNSELHSIRVKQGIKAAKERKAREREVSDND